MSTTAHTVSNLDDFTEKATSDGMSHVQYAGETISVMLDIMNTLGLSEGEEVSSEVMRTIASLTVLALSEEQPYVAYEGKSYAVPQNIMDDLDLKYGQVIRHDILRAICSAMY